MPYLLPGSMRIVGATSLPTSIRFPAHISLFHRLPGDELLTIQRTLESTAKECSVFALQVAGLRSLGYGVAYEVQSAELLALRRLLVSDLGFPWSRQDQQRYKPHVTIQNKVSAAHAFDTFEALQKAFTPFEIHGMGLCLWEYLDGPWKLISSFDFV